MTAINQRSFPAQFSGLPSKFWVHTWATLDPTPTTLVTRTEDAGSLLTARDFLVQVFVLKVEDKACGVWRHCEKLISKLSFHKTFGCYLLSKPTTQTYVSSPPSWPRRCFFRNDTPWSLCLLASAWYCMLSYSSGWCIQLP